MTFKALTLAALAAATLLTGAGAASAQEFGGPGFGGWGFRPPPPPQPVDFRFGGGDELRGREDRMQGWIDASARSGRLSYWRAERAQGDLNGIRADQRRAAWYGGGLSGWQVARLNGRLDQLSGFIRASDDFGGDYPPPPPPRW